MGTGIGGAAEGICAVVAQVWSLMKLYVAQLYVAHTYYVLAGEESLICHEDK